MKSKQLIFALPAAFAVLSLSACNSTGASTPSASIAEAGTPAPGGGTSTPPPTGSPSRSYSTDALLFVGDGSWGSEVSAIEDIFKAHGTTFQEVTSAQLDGMSVDDMAKFGMFVFPGGAGGTEAGSLSATTHANIRDAVQVRGMGYIGFCAGAFIAEAPKPAAGQDVSYGLGVVDGPVLDYYYLENQGTDIAMTMESFPDGSKRDLLWYGGPVTPNTGVIAKYPDGNPAISQVRSGAGFVIMSGVHPTVGSAVKSSLGMNDSDGDDQDFAWSLFNATLHQQPLPQF